MAESTGAIYTAAGANLAIAVAKFAGAGLTGSTAMLAEGVHSLVDTANQGLLLFGMRRAKRPADARHPFGYGREVYFYAFIVALMIFLGGGIFAIYEGVEKIGHPKPVRDATVMGYAISGFWTNVAILGFAILFAFLFLAMELGMPTGLASLVLQTSAPFTVLLGVLFLVLKGIEYSIEYREHLVPGLNFARSGRNAASIGLFFSFYFVATGVHALHVAIGIVVLGSVGFRAYHRAYSSRYHAPITVAGLYWHFVDVVWVFLFALIYLPGRSP